MVTRCSVAAGVVALLVASVAFADLPKPSDIPPLIKKLKSGPPKARADAAKELGKIGQVKASYIKEAIPALLTAAKDKDDTVRKEALVALGTANANPEDAVPVMIDGLKSSNDQVKIAAADGLSFFGSDASEALPELRKIREELNKLSMDERRKKRNLMQAVNQTMPSI